MADKKAVEPRHAPDPATIAAGIARINERRAAGSPPVIVVNGKRYTPAGGGGKYRHP